MEGSEERGNEGEEGEEEDEQEYMFELNLSKVRGIQKKMIEEEVERRLQEANKKLEEEKMREDGEMVNGDMALKLP